MLAMAKIIVRGCLIPYKKDGMSAYATWPHSISSINWRQAVQLLLLLLWVFCFLFVCFFQQFTYNLNQDQEITPIATYQQHPFFFLFFLQRAKMPSKLPPDHLILERRKQDDQREEAVAVTKYNALCDLKNDWEKITDKRIQQNTVRRRVSDLMQQSEFTLEDRRQR